MTHRRLHHGSSVLSVERRCILSCAHLIRFECVHYASTIIVTICIVHLSQLKNMIAALYSCRTDGSKNFQNRGVHFGWDTIERVYERDLYRAQHCISRRVPGLKYAHVVRDNWTRLNVLPAKIMQVSECLQAQYSISIIIFFSIATLHAVSDQGASREDWWPGS